MDMNREGNFCVVGNFSDVEPILYTTFYSLYICLRKYNITIIDTHSFTENDIIKIKRK